MMNRLISYWVYGGFLSGIVLLLLTPALAKAWPVLAILTFLHLPIYMFHQYEEHDNGRFRLFLNRTVGRGKDVLSPTAVFVINIFGVWGVILLSLYLALTVNPGFGLIAVYLALVNAVVHIAHAVIFRGYNPGLGTAIVLFLPLGICTLARIQAAGYGTPFMHAICLAVAIGIHAAIIAHVVPKLRAA
ncbi:MAG: HXXEE domain-containing protein [Alphaproteobacteria bacterium]|nr:HXXEE domain-containing protein [Alphaproteobacteria bacterium]